MTDINVLTGGAPKEALTVLTPRFEAQSGHTVRYTYAVISEIQKKLAAGESPDLVFLPVPAIDGLVKAGTLRAAPRAVLGSVGIGVIVRAGAPQPDIATPESFRAALLAARAVVHANPAATPSGAHLAKVTQQLGIDDALKGKLSYCNALDGGVERITKGEAEIGIYPVSEVIAVKGIALIGLLPPALQSLIVYGAAVLTTNPAPEPAAALIAFLTDPTHRAVWTQAGFAPGDGR
jgi:molybdate transport system substrate-binding protein